MSFESFLNQAWMDHAKNAESVANRFVSALPLIEKNEQIPQLSQLVTHVMGEHLGKWQEGILFLNSLKHLKPFTAGSESEKAIDRSIAVLKLASGDEAATNGFTPSDIIRIFAVTSSALSEQAQTARAQAYFREALQRAEQGLSKEDPANRALAVTGNNLACSLEEKPERTSEEKNLMILAAQTGRKFWEIAGTWLEVERAEYRLAMTYLKAEEPQKAYDHAQTCIDIMKKNGADTEELSYGYQALDLAKKALGQI